MRLAVAAAAAALLAACGPKASSHTTTQSAPPPPATCDNVVQPPIAAFVTDGMVQDLGTIAVGTTVPFNVPGGTAAFFIVSQGLGTVGDEITTWQSGSGLLQIPNVVVPTMVTGPAPSHTLYYDDMAPLPTMVVGGLTYYDLAGLLVDPGLDEAIGVFSFPDTVGALAQLASGGGSVAAGTWTFIVNDYALECYQSALSYPGSCTGGSTSGKYHVYVVTRPGPPSGGSTLDVDVYLASTTLPSAAAEPSAQMIRWKQSLNYYLGNAGISLGAVAFHDLPASVMDKYAPNGEVDVSSSGPCSDLSQLFASGLAQSRGVNVFLADALIAPALGAYHIAGIDGSIPGPSGFTGTINSGTVVGIESFGHESFAGACSASGPPNIANCGTDFTAYVAAHEIGHWLGLYHVTEQDGTLFDPLSDTSICPCNACAPTADRSTCADAHPNVSVSSETLVTSAWCTASAGCGGGDNLMFWLVDLTYSTGALSPQQGQIMRLNPAVH